MIKNYINLAFKSIIRQGSQSLISAIGLSVALSCGIIIFLYVQYELSYDNYHKNANRIFRIVAKQPGHKYMGKTGYVVTAGPLKEALINDIPEIKYSTKCTLRSHILESNSSLFIENGFLYADTDFLKIFKFHVISGNPSEVLKEPFAIFITKEMAKKYFGDADPVGKIIMADNSSIFTVRGVLENIPVNSHFQFNFLTGFETLYSIRGGKEKVEKWGTNSFITYIELMDNVKPEDIKTKLADLCFKYIDKEKYQTPDQLIPEPLRTIHLSGNANFELGNNNDSRFLFLLSSIGVFILLIACFNYVNIATAKSFDRRRETGILKVTGCTRADLIFQLLTESVIISFGGLFLALAIVWILLPVFSDFTDSPLTYKMIFEFSRLAWIVLLTLFVGIFTGVYPAVHLSLSSPLHLIKMDLRKTGDRSKWGNLKNILIVLQYFISIVALVCTFIVWKQLSFIKSTDPGFVTDNILNVYLRDPAIRKNPEALINELKKNMNIVDFATSSDLPINMIANWSADWDGKTAEQNLNVFRGGIDDKFIHFYNLEIISGRSLSKEYSADSAKSIIINQSAARKLDWKDPVGKRLSFNNNTEHGSVVGVIRDFYFHSLHHPIEPLSLAGIGSNSFPLIRYLSIKVRPGSVSETRIHIEKTLKDFSPHYLNSVTILKDQFDKMYLSDKKLGSIFIFSTVLAVILTCLGQYSLSSYTTKTRTREMVIRKIMGSQFSEIMVLLITDMTKRIILSAFFAWPTSYYLMTKWLQNFAFHIKLTPGIFIFSLLTTILISLLAISFHVIKLSRVNPAAMIRNE